MTHWYAIRTATRQEAKAAASIREYGCNVYLPVETRWKITKRLKERTHVPLFAGYLFVECEPEQTPAILDLEGVHQFVRYITPNGDPAPMPIPAAQIEGVRQEEEAGRYDITRPSKRQRELAERKAKALKSGAEMRITDGPFAGFLARVIETRMSERAALVDVTLFGRVSRVELPVGDLEAV